MQPQYQQVGQYRWNQLYNSADHLRLIKAIAKELQKNYEEYKRRHSNNYQFNYFITLNPFLM